jgi:hypothetical protein
MILYHSADLFWATRIKGTADGLGIPACPVRTIDMLEARLADSTIKAMVVDLDAPEIAVLLINRLRCPNATPTERGIVILAYGPHVAVDAFEAARKAGADWVLARGAFARNLPDWLRALSGGAGTFAHARDSLPTEE